MIIRKYEQFLFESIINASDEFIKILRLMKDDIVAIKLLELLEKDIKTNYNFIKISDEAGKLMFLPDSQASRKLATGSNKEELFAAANNPTTINRMIKSLFNMNSIEVSEIKLEVFGNKFKSLMELLQGKNIFIYEVSGKEIIKWYNQDSYSNKRVDTPLHKSCMRYEHCAEYFDIYVQNPDLVSMIIKLDKPIENADAKLEARALLWKTNDGFYLDRVYFIKEEYTQMLYHWCLFRLENLIYHLNLNGKKLSVNLPTKDFYDHYPYMDTFCYLHKMESGLFRLLNWDPDDAKNTWVLHETDGSIHHLKKIWCQYYDTWLDREEAVESTRFDVLPRAESCYSDYHEDWFPKELSVWSEAIGSYIWNRVAVKVNIDMKGNTDYFPRELNEKYFQEVTTSEFYVNDLKDDFFFWNSKYYNLDNAIFVKAVSNNSLDKWIDITEMDYYTSTSYYCTDLDQKVFNLNTESEQLLLAKRNYYYQFINIQYSRFIEKIKKQAHEGVSQKLIDEKCKEHEKVHEWINA